MNQRQLMKFCPAFGSPKPYPSEASQWRLYYENEVWRYNPWTGSLRHVSDVESDPQGLLIAIIGESLARGLNRSFIQMDELYLIPKASLLRSSLAAQAVACVEEKVMAIIATESGIRVDQILPTDELEAGLRMDSLNLVELMMELEDEFEIEFTAESNEHTWTTVQDVVSCVQALVLTNV